jgi:hypothetical protein
MARRLWQLIMNVVRYQLFEDGTTSTDLHPLTVTALNTQTKCQIGFPFGIAIPTTSCPENRCGHPASKIILLSLGMRTLDDFFLIPRLPSVQTIPLKPCELCLLYCFPTSCAHLALTVSLTRPSTIRLPPVSNLL